MKSENRNTGKFGEDIAADFLHNKGYKILKRNFSNKFGEIDIVAEHKNILIFVEVKTKRGEEFGTPEEMISKGKLNKIKMMGNLYMRDKVQPCRIDVVAIVLDEYNEVERINHYEGVY